MRIDRWSLLVALGMLSCRAASSPDSRAPTCKPSSGATRAFAFRIENDLASPAIVRLTVDGCPTSLGGGDSIAAKGERASDLAVGRDGRHRLVVSVTAGATRLEWTRVIAEIEDDVALVVSDRTGLATVAPAREPTGSTCESTDTALVPIRIRYVDTTSTDFVLRNLDLRLDGKPLTDDPRKLAAQASTGSPVTCSLSTSRRCHTLAIALEYAGAGGAVAGYKFEMQSSRVFEAFDGTVLDLIAYEHEEAVPGKRLAVRYHERRHTPAANVSSP